MSTKSACCSPELSWKSPTLSSVPAGMADGSSDNEVLSAASKSLSALPSPNPVQADRAGRAKQDVSMNRGEARISRDGVNRQPTTSRPRSVGDADIGVMRHCG
jgi:hypothetical protein